MTSPYLGRPSHEWFSITQTLVSNHPLEPQEIVDTVLFCWQSILETKLGSRNFQIGKDIFPKPQIMGFFLHELIPLELEAKYPGFWRGERTAFDKDIVYLPDDSFSIEVKTSSAPNRIYGNRSYAQETGRDKKRKSGYYLAINFEKFSISRMPSIRLIRFGWIDSSDWIAQKAATGQQSRLAVEVEKYKLLELYRQS
ncbi:ScaI family restriction endonuclease [Oscillatoria sp. FACHB-1406]|uniref:ScaI family restriction endonuclease n=1 Tax=Oscillatoria sp. FACHB-1406 TaxID=2692846 RepID=UPI0016885D64|nr:ScaI family restriction endonuclease [Oscillatoria sp. FACHB-1406]MBD2580285.1 ScaI family restriction endonuclease [Oscillatoria sp. FACHB-1406]